MLSGVDRCWWVQTGLDVAFVYTRGSIVLAGMGREMMPVQCCFGSYRRL